MHPTHFTTGLPDDLRALRLLPAGACSCLPSEAQWGHAARGPGPGHDPEEEPPPDRARVGQHFVGARHTAATRPAARRARALPRLRLRRAGRGPAV